MINKQQYKQLRETFNEVVIPGIQKGILKLKVGDLWVTKTKYDKVVFAEALCGTKEFPLTYTEVGSEGKLSHEQLSEFYYKLKKKNFL